MSVPRLFHCTVAGLVIATGLSFLFGASGVFNYRDLRTYEAHVADGIAALQDRHRRLQQRAAVFRDNPEALRLLARRAGYFRPGETVIEVGPAPVDPTDAAGARAESGLASVAPLLQHTPPVPRDPFNALALGLFLGAGSFAALALLRAVEHRRLCRQPDAPRQPDAAASGCAVDDAPPTPAPPAAANGSTPPHGDREAPARPAAAPESEPAGRRRKPRRRRRDVTVYRL